MTTPTILRRAGCALALATLIAAPAAQAQATLPSADSVLAAYHAAAGGRARLAAIRDATYEWRLESGGRTVGTAASRRMPPGSLLEEIAGRGANASTPTVSWRRRGSAAAVVDTSAGVALGRLQAALEASWLVNLAAQGIAARVTGADTADGARAWRVEFSRDGARRTWLMDARTGLPLRVVVDEGRGLFVRYSEYRAVDGVLEPHRVEIAGPTGGLAFVLLGVRYDTGLTQRDFLPPSGAP